MSEKRAVPLYQVRTATGSVRQQVAGVEAALQPGDSADAPGATWLVRADSLGGHRPQAGDRVRVADGVWWVVAAVGARTEGAYPCRCARAAQE